MLRATFTQHIHQEKMERGWGQATISSATLVQPYGKGDGFIFTRNMRAVRTSDIQGEPSNSKVGKVKDAHG